MCLLKIQHVKLRELRGGSLWIPVPFPWVTFVIAYTFNMWFTGFIWLTDSQSMRTVGYWASMERNAVWVLTFSCFYLNIYIELETFCWTVVHSAQPPLSAAWCPYFSKCSRQNLLPSTTYVGDSYLRVAVAWDITVIQLETYFPRNQALRCVWGNISNWQSEGKWTA